MDPDFWDTLYITFMPSVRLSVKMLLREKKKLSSYYSFAIAHWCRHQYKYLLQPLGIKMLHVLNKQVQMEHLAAIRAFKLY